MNNSKNMPARGWSAFGGKKTNLIATSAAAMVALIAISGVAMSTFASEDATVLGQELNSRFGRHMSDEQKAERQELREVRQVENEAKREAVDAAIKAGSYSAWVTAVGEDCPMLENINEGNFSRFSEAHNLREQAKLIMEELGIEKEGRKGFGKMRGGKGHFMR